MLNFHSEDAIDKDGKIHKYKDKLDKFIEDNIIHVIKSSVYADLQDIIDWFYKEEGPFIDDKNEDKLFYAKDEYKFYQLS